jgi:Domain of unknown function (DUF4157)/Heterokaryon incompatibility protein Het-C
MQPKLFIGAVNDPLEHEADRVADQVMRMPDPALSIAAAPSQVSRKCACEEDKTLQTKLTPSANATAAFDVESAVRATERGGEPLPSALRSYFEPRFGRDFSQERIHADSEAWNKTNPANARSPPASRTITRATSIQRSLDSSVAKGRDDLSALLGGALASPGMPLDATTRAFMEPRLGQDFSGVRVHADPPSALTARALNARAFAVGDHILFGAGHYEPATWTGRRIIAHELTHVVQQRSGVVTGKPGPDGISVDDPTGRFEHAAETVATRVMSYRSAAAPVMETGPLSHPTPGRSGAKAIQRFLAGEEPEGHGGIEEPALEEAGFSKAEAHSTYAGNWLRDFSQQLDAASSDPGARLEIVKILFTGQFGRAPEDSEIGRYLPSEHVDNPAGSESAENPDISAEMRAKRREALSPAQREFVDEEQTAKFKQQVATQAASSGLPVYIERAKEHVKRQIAEAAALGRNDKGRAALGNGLHAVEDYFAHSNFVEVALAQLEHEGEVGENNPKIRAMQNYYEVDPTNIDTDKFGRPQIVTGTSAPGASETVGVWEAVKTELRNDEFRRVFLRGAILRYGRDLPIEAGRKLPNLIGSGVGAVLGAAGGAVAGAARGAVAGWRGAQHWYQKPIAAIGGFLGGAVRGFFQGAASGAKTGWRIGGQVDAAVGSPLSHLGGLLGRVAGFGLGAAAAAVVLAILGLVALVTVPGGPALQAHAKRKIREGTRQTVSEAGAKKAALPTHSQIAKDDPDHPLHGAADRLARIADREIGRQMIKVWESKGAEHQEAVAAAQALVDFYMAHPQQVDITHPRADPWWKAELLSAVKGKGP